MGVLIPLHLASQDVQVNDYYYKCKYETYFDSLPNLSLIKGPVELTAGLSDLIKGDYKMFGPKKDETAAYNFYIKVYNESEEHTFLKKESLERLIRYTLYSNNNLTKSLDHINEHKQVCTTVEDSTRNDYYNLRYQCEYEFDKKTTLSYDEAAWEALFKSCETHSLFRLKSESHSVRAVLFEGIDRVEEAIDEYNEAINSSKLVDDRHHANVKFSANANLGALYLFSKTNYTKSLDHLRTAVSANLKKEQPRNVKTIYEWMSESHKGLNNKDSAYHYLRKSFDEEIKNKLTSHSIAVKEIQEKYDNEKLSLQLLEVKADQLKSKLLITIFGGLASLFAIIGIAVFRFQRLKRKAVDQELETTKIKATLDATRAKMEGEQKERQSIASTLHDQVASLLTAADMHLKVAKKKNEGEASIGKATDILKKVNYQIRDLSHKLVSPTLMKFGLEPAIDTFVNEMQNDNLKIYFDSHIGQRRYESSIENFIFNSCTELIQMY